MTRRRFRIAIGVVALTAAGCPIESSAPPFARDRGPDGVTLGDGSGKSDALLLDARVADGPVRDASAQDASARDADIPDAPLPDAPVGDARVPDAPLRDALVPDAPGRDTRASDAPVRDALVPDAPVPDAAVPDASVPDASVRDAPVPDALVPDALVSDAAALDGAAGDGLVWTDTFLAPRPESTYGKVCNLAAPGACGLRLFCVRLSGWPTNVGFCTLQCRAGVHVRCTDSRPPGMDTNTNPRCNLVGSTRRFCSFECGNGPASGPTTNKRPCPKGLACTHRFSSGLWICEPTSKADGGSGG